MKRPDPDTCGILLISVPLALGLCFLFFLFQKWIIVNEIIASIVGGIIGIFSGYIGIIVGTRIFSNGKGIDREDKKEVGVYERK